MTTLVNSRDQITKIVKLSKISSNLNCLKSFDVLLFGNPISAMCFKLN